MVPCRAKRRSVVVQFGAIALLASLGVFAVGNTEPVRADESSHPACIEHRSEARYRGYGYQHIVIIKNNCDDTAQCKVSTDVTPEPVEISVPANAERSVLTRRGAPGSAFKAVVRCSV